MLHPILFQTNTCHGTAQTFTLFSGNKHIVKYTLTNVKGHNRTEIMTGQRNVEAHCQQRETHVAS